MLLAGTDYFTACPCHEKNGTQIPVLIDPKRREYLHGAPESAEIPTRGQRHAPASLADGLGVGLVRQRSEHTVVILVQQFQQCPLRPRNASFMAGTWAGTLRPDSRSSSHWKGNAAPMKRICRTLLCSHSGGSSPLRLPAHRRRGELSPSSANTGPVQSVSGSRSMVSSSKERGALKAGTGIMPPHSKAKSRHLSIAGLRRMKDRPQGTHILSIFFKDSPCGWHCHLRHAVPEQLAGIYTGRALSMELHWSKKRGRL